MTDIETAASVPLFALSSAVFAQRDGKILVLKRAGGAATGGWYLPGGAFDPGESILECARRELFEESGLIPTGDLTCVAVAHMHVYGHESLQVLYAGECAEGEVTLSNEHSASRWIDPVVYRERYFAEDVIDRFAGLDAQTGAMLRNIRDAIDSFLRWRALTMEH
jgi:8-oxo-dGTP pyrophosphatase MutT (NUDIX family)